jgi:murein DD-endopeptidase MepM/ murein hydrolase activator NlpD
MMSPRRIGLTLALTLPVVAAAVLAACARTAPPAPVMAGQSGQVRAMSGVLAPPPAPPPVAVALPPPVTFAAAPPVAVAVPAPAPAIPPPVSLPPPVQHADASAIPSASSRRGPAHPEQVTVRPGETLYAISRRYGVPVRSLIEANGLAPPYALAAGRRLAVPQVRLHTVQPGETLYSVSRLYGIDTTTLARSNALPPPYMVFVGQSLVLPAPVQVAEGATAPPAAPEPLAAEPKPLPPARIEPAAGPTPRTELAALPPPRVGTPGGRFLWPVRGRLLTEYGTGEGGTRNDGINIAAPAGTTVLAADAGTVAYAGNELRGYGNLILIKHANGWMTAYAHNSALLVKRGEKVRRGQPIARIGATGAVTRPQLHFEVRHGAKALDPTDYLPPSSATSVNG